MQKTVEFSAAELDRFRRDLLLWYARCGRDLPWRRSVDPYHVWVSEIMLQQTRVDQARPYFDHFLKRFPDVHSLASAHLDEVLLLWEGLGYYSRARNLHRAAAQIVNEMGGVFPADAARARKLAGVGPYTAAAVVSIAYGKPEAAIDGNVTRVLSRYLSLETPVDRVDGRRAIQSAAESLIDRREPGAFNQAMMDLGATICTPTSPQCESCPLSAGCRALAEGSVNAYPIAAKRGPVPHYDVAVGIVVNERDELLLTQRSEKTLLGGLWEFPGARRNEGESLHDACRRGIADTVGMTVEPVQELLSIRHAFSHFKMTLHAFSCDAAPSPIVAESSQPYRWISRSELGGVALHRSARKIADYVSSHGGSAAREPQ